MKRGFVIGAITILVILGLAIFVVVDAVGSRTATLYQQTFDPQEMKDNYEAMHTSCASVRTLWQHWQTDKQAADAFAADPVHKPILDGTAKDTPLGNVHNEYDRLRTVATGDHDQLAEAAGTYDNLVETKTKDYGSLFVQKVFFDNGLPKSIQPPYDSVDCGSGSWEAPQQEIPKAA